ncbi:MAG: hypothetical protein AABX66_03995 [Nanoarchaeota archaeon]
MVKIDGNGLENHVLLRYSNNVNNVCAIRLSQLDKDNASLNDLFGLYNTLRVAVTTRNFCFENEGKNWNYPFGGDLNKDILPKPFFPIGIYDLRRDDDIEAMLRVSRTSLLDIIKRAINFS